MKIGVVSDTHSRPLPQVMVKDFQSVDLILHAGDLCDEADCERLLKIAPVEAVSGNMDNSTITDRFPKRKIVSCGNFRIGLFHGEGAPGSVLERAMKEFAKDKVDAVVFGHSHHPVNETRDGVLYFNPGSPTDEIFAPYRSYGILEVDEQGIKGRIVKITEA